MIRRVFIRTIFVFFATSLLLTHGCHAQKSEVVECKIDVGRTYQTIDNFGASDCWTLRFIGNWPDVKRNAIADLLFSNELDKTGKPKGIGLSLWRFNIGSGSAGQGDLSSIRTDWRRSECLMNPDGSFDWSRQAGQRWFMRAAKQRGVNQFLAFANTPPVYFTQNGLGTNKGREKTLNLKADKYDAYADFLVNVITGIAKNDSVKINYISPFNEPEWDWDGPDQEGTPALLSEIATEIRLLDKKLGAYNLDTKIMVGESGQIDYMYQSNTNKPGRDNQIIEFFSPSSQNYIGNLSHVPQLMPGHAYWSVSPVSTLIQKRSELNAAMQKAGLKYWQTEYCIMGNDVPEGGGKRDLTMNTALFVARIIHNDLVVANASAWHWWLGVTYSDYKDGLVYVEPNEDKTDGTYTDSKLLWALGNYSLFIRPGSVRVDVSSFSNINNPEGLMVSSYINREEKTLVTTLINYGNKDCSIKLNIPGLEFTNQKIYITSDKEGDNLAPANVSANAAFVVPQRSVVTFVGKY